MNYVMRLKIAIQTFLRTVDFKWESSNMCWQDMMSRNLEGA